MLCSIINVETEKGFGSLKSTPLQTQSTLRKESGNLPLMLHHQAVSFVYKSYIITPPSLQGFYD